MIGMMISISPNRRAVMVIMRSALKMSSGVMGPLSPKA